MASGAVARGCGACTLCCTLLRVDELKKLGGSACRELRAAPLPPGCGIHATRPPICRAYRCLWLAGGLDEGDRPDRLGAILDVATEGGVTRLREIVARYRQAMPVRIANVAQVDDAGAPVRELGPAGAELRSEGEWIVRLEDGRERERRRLPWLERRMRRVALAFRRRKLRGYY